MDLSKSDQSIIFMGQFVTTVLAALIKALEENGSLKSGQMDETSYEDCCVKSVLFSADRHRPVPSRVGILGCRGGAPCGEGALANLVSGGTASPPRSLIRVGGAPRRAAPLYISGAVRQPTSRHGHRSLGPTGPVPPSGSGPICLSAFAGVAPARKHPLMPCRRLPSGRLQLHPLRDGPVLNVSPERDQELSRQGHDHDLAQAPPRAAQAVVEPARERAAGLVAQPHPGEFNERRAQPPVAVLANPLLALRAAAAVGRPGQPRVGAERAGVAEPAYEGLVNQHGRGLYADAA